MAPVGRRRCLSRDICCMEMLWENHGKIMGKLWENCGKIMGKSSENEGMLISEHDFSAGFGIGCLAFLKVDG